MCPPLVSSIAGRIVAPVFSRTASVFHRTIAILGCALFLAGSPAPPAVRGHEIIDDAGIVERMEKEGAVLMEAKKTVPLRTLRQRLAKAHSCTLTLPVGDAAPHSPAEIYARCAKGVLVVGVLAKCKDCDRFEMSGCSGFALTADGVFATNYHVVDDADAETLIVMTRDGQIAPVTEVLAADKLADVAILRAPGITCAPLPLAPEPPPPGSPVWALSHPDHNFYSFTSGMVSRHFLATTDDGKTPQMAITADFGVGSSGGPILDAAGLVVGMVCSTTSVYYQDEKEKVNDVQMVFKHCVPVGSIQRLIDAAAGEKR